MSREVGREQQMDPIFVQLTQGRGVLGRNLVRTSLPAGVLFPVTIGVLGAVGALGVARLPNDLYA